MRFSIPEQNIESLEKKLTRIRNKCGKYGCEFHYERLGEHIEETTYYEYEDGHVSQFKSEFMGAPVPVREFKELVRYIDIEVDGTAALNGWRFAASLEYTDKGNIVSGTGGIEIPSRYYDCAPWCEHCKTARDRKYSFIVFNEESGEFKQVGKACLKDFTGGLSATDVANFESFFKECEEASEFRGLGGWGKTYFDVKDFMVCVAEAIRLYGYFKRDGFSVSTGERAEELYRSEYGMKLFGKIARERVDDAKAKGFDIKNPESVALAEKVREFVLASDREDNYFHNLKVACGLEYGDYKVLGLLSSAFPTYDRELEIAAERAAREAKEADARARSTWMGKVGDKVSFKITESRCLTSWESQWGLVAVYKFVDESGREATWKTGSWVEEDKAVGGVITGKIKELKEYRGVKQTELTRCRIEYPKKKEKGFFEKPDGFDEEAAKKAQAELKEALDMLYVENERGA